MVRPRLSTTQRQALPPSIADDENTLLPSTCSVLSNGAHAVQALPAPSGCTCHRSVWFVQRQSPCRIRTRFVNVTVSFPFCTAAPAR